MATERLPPPNLQVGHSLDHFQWILLILPLTTPQQRRARPEKSCPRLIAPPYICMYVMYDSIANIFTTKNTLGEIKILGLKENACRRKLDEEIVQSCSINKHICLLSFKRCGNKLLVLEFQTQTVPVIMWQPKISNRRTIIITGLPNQT